MVRVNDEIRALDMDGNQCDRGKVTKIQAPRGLGRENLDVASPGDVIMIAGLSKATVSHTVCSPVPALPAPLTAAAGGGGSPARALDRSTDHLNDVQWREGNKLTSAMIRDRVRKETENNISFSIGESPDGSSEGVLVMARGSMQLGILIEDMRREGFELSVGPPQVLFKESEKGKKLEPIEEVFCEMGEAYSGVVMDALAARKGEVVEMTPAVGGRCKIVAHVPSRTLMGYRGDFNTSTHGTGVMFCSFHGYEDYRGGTINIRRGVIVSTDKGDATAYSLSAIEPRGELFIKSQQPVYQGMIIGEHSKSNDIEVNPTKAKQLTNMRASGTDEAIRLAPPRLSSLEESMGYIQDDELLEVTPTRISMRKAHLDPSSRKRAMRKSARS